MAQRLVLDRSARAAGRLPAVRRAHATDLQPTPS
jgi:hypothetical protein